MKPKAHHTAKPAAPSTRKKAHGPITLAFDIGGSGIKAMLLDADGQPASERERLVTPQVPNPAAVLPLMHELARRLSGFDRVSVGFPGVTKKGVTYTAVNLHPDWMGFHFQSELEKRWRKPVRVANDASIQGYGAIHGEGVEMVITLGTGMGSCLFTSGRLCPGLELGHHPWKKHTYEDYIGRRGFDKYGKQKWNKHLREAIEQTALTFNWDHLYLGGGNAKKIDFELPEHVSIVSNETGLLGGVALWRDEALGEKHT